MSDIEKEYAFVMLRPGALRRKKFIYIFKCIKELNLDIECIDKKEVTEEFVFNMYKHLICDEVPYDVYERTMIENLSGEVIGIMVSGENALFEIENFFGTSLSNKIIKKQI